MLEADGINCHVSGQYLQGGIGELASMDFARVYVDEENYQKALPLLLEYDNNSADTDASISNPKKQKQPVWLIAAIFLTASLTLYLITSN